MIRQHASMWKSGQWIARGVFAAALLSGCGQESTGSDTSTATDDTTSQYAALSASLQSCEDAQTKCTTDAAGDATKVAACDAKAMECTQKTKDAEDHAHKDLRGAAEGCVKARHCSKDDDAGPGDACHPEMHKCMEKHAPQLPPCFEALFMCLDKTGIRESNAQLTDATKAAIGACVDTAHTCFMNSMANNRRDHRGGPGFPGFPGQGGPGQAGHGFPGAAGSHAAEAGRPSFPGFPGEHHDGEAGRGEAGRAGFPFAGAPAHEPGHAAAGADSHEHAGSGWDGRGPGRRGEGGAGGGH